GAVARGPAPACGNRVLRPGRVRERGGRREDHRAGSRPGGAAGGRVLAQEPAVAGEARGVRGGRAGGRSAPGAAWPGAPAGGGEARLHARARAARQPAAPGGRGSGGVAGAPHRGGGRPLPGRLPRLNVGRARGRYNPVRGAIARPRGGVMAGGSPYELGLGKNAANYTPLTPLSLFARTVYTYPERTAVIHGDWRLTWGEVGARCRALASALKARGIGAGD